MLYFRHLKYSISFFLVYIPLSILFEAGEIKYMDMWYEFWTIGSFSCLYSYILGDVYVDLGFFFFLDKVWNELITVNRDYSIVIAGHLLASGSAHSSWWAFSQNFLTLQLHQKVRLVPNNSAQVKPDTHRKLARTRICLVGRLECVGPICGSVWLPNPVGWGRPLGNMLCRCGLDQFLNKEGTGVTQTGSSVIKVQQRSSGRWRHAWTTAEVELGCTQQVWLPHKVARIPAETPSGPPLPMQRRFGGGSGNQATGIKYRTSAVQMISANLTDFRDFSVRKSSNGLAIFFFLKFDRRIKSRDQGRLTKVSRWRDHGMEVTSDQGVS